MECVKTSTKTSKGHCTSSGLDFSEVNHIVNADGQYIFCQFWEPSSVPKGLVLIIHGYAEHCLRHEKLAQALCDEGLFVFSQDLASHGESEGQRLNVPSYNVFLRDLLQLSKQMKSKYPDLPLFVFGHSMGGALATLLVHQNPDLACGVVISSGLLMKTAEFTNSIKVTALKLLSYIVPNMAVGTLDPSGISTDEEQVKIYKEDSLVYHGPVILNMGCQMLYLIEEVLKVVPDVSFPFLAMHGADDIITYPDGSRNLHEKANSKDKSIKIFEGCLHELGHEAGDVPDRYVEEVKSWITERM